MDGISFDLLSGPLYNMAFQLVKLFFICGIAYIVVFLVLRLLKLPMAITKFIAGIAFIVVFYFSFMNVFLPGLT
jgi:hypothetical protein